MFTLQSSDHVQMVATVALNERHRADKSLSEVDGWMFVHS